MDFLKSKYTSTTDRLTPLLENGEITYDLLWALFKPNTIVYTTCLDTEKPACFRFDRSEESATSADVTYLHLECRYPDSDGVAFGEVSTGLGIAKFAGTKRIIDLDVFPLRYHPRRNKMKADLVERGRHFVSLLGIHYRQYRGNAFFLERGEVTEIYANSRIMVDAAFFRENSPNYLRPRINGLEEKKALSDGWFAYSIPEPQVKSRELPELTDGDLLLCSPTVRGWSFGNKQWSESSSCRL